MNPKFLVEELQVIFNTQGECPSAQNRTPNQTTEFTTITSKVSLEQSTCPG